VGVLPSYQCLCGDFMSTLAVHRHRDVFFLGGIIEKQPYWPEENSTSIVCELSERDDDAAQGLFRVTCPKLSKELNNKMELISNGEEIFSLPDTNKVAFNVALNGPMPRDEWLELRGNKRYVNHAERLSI